MTPVVVVTEDDRPTGTAEKITAHKKGWLHRAFSVFVFDSKGRLLLQQRTADKYHSGGLWSNTCCSHPKREELPLTGARRRLREEMGFDTPLRSAFRKKYHLPVGPDLVEHEFNHVFVGNANGVDIRPSACEVARWRWITVSELRQDLVQNPDRYTAWFRLLLDDALAAAGRSQNGHSARES